MADLHVAEREKLRALQNIFENAVANNSIEDMRDHVSENFSFVSFTDRMFTDFDSFAKQWKITREEMVGGGSFTTQLNPFATLFIGDVAIATGNATNHMLDKKGDNYEFSSNWTVVLQQEKNSWKVIRAHNSLNPFSSPMLKTGIKRALTKVGITTFLLGALSAWLIGQIV